MGYSSLYDICIAPFLRDLNIFLPTLLMWFIVQWSASYVLIYICRSSFTQLVKQKQTELSIRCVSIFNGILMIGSAVCFLSNLYSQHFTFSDNYYKEISGYRFFRISIISYFVWDIIICYKYQWEIIWKIHAVTSCVGAYLLSFPFSDEFGSYYSGMFELCNIPLHISIILKILNHHHHHHNYSSNFYILLMEKIFIILFFLIRVLGGSIISILWFKKSYIYLFNNYYYFNNKLIHSEFSIILCMLLVIIVQILQYIWFIEIIKKIIYYFKFIKNK